MAADSSTYDDATQQRRYAMAQALLAPPATPITHWAQGLDELGKGALGGYQIAQLGAERKAEKVSEKADLYTALGLPAPAPAVEAPTGFAKILGLLSGGGQGAPASPVAAPVAPPPAAPIPAIPAPVSAAPAGSAPPVSAPAVGPRPEVLPTAKVWGDKEAEDAGLYEKPGAKVAQALSAPSPAGGILADVPADKKAAIAAMLTSNNPTAKALGMAAITNLTKQDDPISVGGKLVSKQGKVIYDGGDDKTPAGFRKTDGGLEPIPGGPADLAYLRLKAAKEKDPNGTYVLGRGGEVIKNNPDGTVTVVHKNEQEGGEPLTDDAIDFAAKRAIAADPKALTNLGRGQQGRADLAKINNRIAELMRDDPNGAKTIMDNAAKQAGLVSASRALGTKETHFGVAEKAMEESLPLAQTASDAVPRTEWVGLNKLIQMGQTQHANPKLKRFLIATDTAAKDYARTINPTGALRESDIEYARKILSTADGPEAYTAALDQLRMEAGVMHRAIKRQKGELHGGSGPETTTGTPVPAPTTAVDPAALAEAKRRGLVP